MTLTNTTKITKLLAILFLSTLTFTACSDDHDDDHDHGSEEELITTVKYTLTNGNDVVTLTFSDPDGEGGNDGTFLISGPLTSSTTYTGVVQLLNESESPAEDVTLEVKAEDDEHEFFYTTSVLGLSIEKTDTDGNGNPLGIETSVTTGSDGAGTITVTLVHEPTKPNNNTVLGASGSTDVQVTFNVTVQ